MIKLDNLIFNIKDINDLWIFGYYLNIQIDSMVALPIRIRSVFNAGDKTPSFFVYMKDNKIKFKDFSTGKQGSAIDLVMTLFNLSYSDACYKILSDYNKWIIDGKYFDTGLILESSNYKVSHHNTRKWNMLDKEFWTDFGIGSNLLKWGLVKPLQDYTMTKEIDTILISGEYLYGYFDKKDNLVKIYQPKNKNCKFVSVKEYLAGAEHLENNDYLMIQSSWKDRLSLKSLNIKIDVVVPNSENSFLPIKFVDEQKKKYKKIITLFDSDDPGIKAAIRYKELYNIDFINLRIAKDLSDSIKEKGSIYVRNRLIPLIHKKIN